MDSGDYPRQPTFFDRLVGRARAATVTGSISMHADLGTPLN